MLLCCMAVWCGGGDVVWCSGTDYYLAKALEIRRTHQGPDHVDVEVLLTKRGNLYHREGKFEQALPLFQSALAIVTKTDTSLASMDRSGKAKTSDAMDSKSRERAAMIRTSIAGILKELGRYSESLPLYEQSLRDKVALYKGYKHYQVAISMSNFAELYLRMQQPEKAIIFYEDARKVMEVTRGLNHPEVATVLINLAGCHVQLKQYVTLTRHSLSPPCLLVFSNHSLLVFDMVVCEKQSHCTIAP